MAAAQLTSGKLFGSHDGATKHQRFTHRQSIRPFKRNGPERQATQCSAVPRSQGACSTGLDRRTSLLALTAAPFAGLLQPASALAADSIQLTQYQDGPDNFSISVPSDWQTGEGQAEGARFGGSTGARRALAWYPDGQLDTTSVSIIITNVGADFTKLGSFGTAETFGENLINSMDRRYLRNSAWGQNKEPIQEAHLLAARERNKLYYVDYSLIKPNETEERIFQTAVALAFNGYYNRLYTVTAQCLKKDMATSGAALRQVVDSFVPPAPVV